MPLRLSHLHLPRPIPYTLSLCIQNLVVTRYLGRRRFPFTPPPPPSSSPTTSHSPVVTPPVLLTFTTHPTYTVGRRHLEQNPLSRAQITYLTAHGAADFHASPRGGLLTYHGPGQLTAYPIIDLRQHKLGARAYVRMLEEVVINTCKTLGVENTGVSCSDPGVWMLDDDDDDAAAAAAAGGAGRTISDRKTCALGVQVTRGVTSHGIGLNVSDAPIAVADAGRYRFEGMRRSTIETGVGDKDAKGYLSWGFGRIVACGLEGKSTTWLEREHPEAKVSIDEVAGTLAGELCAALDGVDKVESISHNDYRGDVELWSLLQAAGVGEEDHDDDDDDDDYNKGMKQGEG